MTSQEMKKTLWEAADKLRAQMDAAEYKHLVLGLIFLKYVSDAFDERRREVAKLQGPVFRAVFLG
jgi:type I restriction enzyme M protein